MTPTAGRSGPLKKSHNMKKTILETIAFSALIVAVFAALVLFTGCASVEKALYNPQAVVTPAATNITQQVILGPTGEPQTIEIPVITPAVTNRVLAPSPIVSGVIEGAKALPFPFAGTAALAVGWLYSAWASFRNKKLAGALVDGVEAARQWLQTTPEGKATDAKLVGYLKTHQEAAGVLNAAAALVNARTGDTVQ